MIKLAIQIGAVFGHSLHFITINNLFSVANSLSRVIISAGDFYRFYTQSIVSKQGNRQTANL